MPRGGVYFLKRSRRELFRQREACHHYHITNYFAGKAESMLVCALTVIIRSFLLFENQLILARYLPPLFGEPRCTRAGHNELQLEKTVLRA